MKLLVLEGGLIHIMPILRLDWQAQLGRASLVVLIFAVELGSIYVSIYTVFLCLFLDSIQDSLHQWASPHHF